MHDDDCVYNNMARQDKQTDINTTETRLSADDLARVNDNQTNNQTNKSKHDRKPFLLLLLMLLIAAPVIVLLANSGFINRTPEPIIEQPPVTLTEIKEVETDLKKVITDLNKINRDTAPKDEPVVVKKVEVKKAEVRPVPVPPKPVAVTPKKIEKQTVKIVSTKVQQEIAAPVVSTAAGPVIQRPAYIKLDNNGSPVDDDGKPWACVLDTKKGLLWEVKSRHDSMRKPDNLYSWFDPDEKKLKGFTDGGRCKGDADCDTHAYVVAMNRQNFCGHNDWRLPTREEMMGLVNYEDNNVKIDTSYFPETLPSWYWTASSNESRPEFAWYVLFKNGISLNDLKENPKHIRLVRSGSSS